MKKYTVNINNKINVYKEISIKAKSKEEAEAKAVNLAGVMMLKNLKKLKLNNNMSNYGCTHLKEVE